MDQSIGQSTIGELLPLTIILGLLLLVIVFCFKMFIVTSKAQSIARKKMAEDRKNGISRYDCIIHVGGLSAPENCKCSVILNSEGLTVVCGGNEFFLRLSKIRNVDFQLDIDEKQYLKSSMAGGIIGAATFGVSGAVIGSAPKTKVKREVKCYAIISYEGTTGDYCTFILRDEIANSNMCAKLVDVLRPLIKTQVNKVEL